MKCKWCNTEIPEGEGFCPACKATLNEGTLPSSSPTQYKPKTVSTGGTTAALLKVIGILVLIISGVAFVIGILDERSSEGVMYGFYGIFAALFLLGFSAIIENTRNITILLEQILTSKDKY